MHLKVGELARSTGLTVRTLHHYDEIGLLRPSARSEAGYRMYAAADVARLHAIQALQYLGLPLAEIGPLLDGEQASIEGILEQQMRVLQQQIRQASELHERLALLRDGILRGEKPGVEDWVQSLALMATYGKYFSADELKTIFQAWRHVESEWSALVTEVRAYMDGGGAIDSMEGQALTRRWMFLMMRWMGGDFALMDRWGAMFRQEPGAQGVGGAPPGDMIAFMESAIALRVQHLQQHFGDIDFRTGHRIDDAQWQQVEVEGRKLLAAGRTPSDPRAQALLQRWLALLDEAAAGDAALRERMQCLHQGHPLLLAGSPLSATVREFLWAAAQSA